MTDSKVTVPDASLPVNVEDYGFPESRDKLLPWEFVSERMAKARNYWICTVSPDGQPHVVPVWGVWVDNVLHFGGAPYTRWARNLEANPTVTVHLEDGTEVVIFEGRVTRITEADDPRLTAIDDAYEVKYDMRHGPPIWILHPRKVLAWKTMDTVTRWLFEE